MALTDREEYQIRLGTPNDIGEMLLDIRDAAVPGFLPDKCFAIVGDTATVIIPPADILVIGVSVEVESFTFRTGDQVVRSVTGVGQGNLLVVPSHGYITGDGPLLATSDGALPTGLVSGTQYYVSDEAVNNVFLYLTREKALSGLLADRVSITGNGSGTRSLGGFASEAATTEQVVGDNILKLSAGDGRGNSPLLPVFVGVRSRTLTVKGETASSILKYAFL